MRFYFLRTICVAVLLFFSSCTHLTVLRTEELRAVQSEIDSLGTEMQDLHNEIAESQTEQEKILRVIRADQRKEFREIDNKLEMLAGNLSESQSKISEITEKTREIKEKWEERNRQDSLREKNRKDEIQNLFELALNDFTMGRYKMALNGFKNIIEKYPETKRAKEADYWIPECHYIMENYKEAEKGYVNYLKKHKEGKKVCVAIYKLGLVYDEQDKEKSRDMVWKKLLKQCPDTDEAKIVKSRINE